MASPHVQVFGHGLNLTRIPPPEGIPVRRMRKAAHAKTCSAKGKEKGLLPTPRQKTIAKRSRSYKWNDYEAWCRTFDGKRNLASGGTS